MSQKHPMQNVSADWFDLSFDLIGILASGGQFLRVNSTFERVLGYGSEELVTHGFLELVHPEDLDSATSQWQSLGQGGGTIEFECRYLSKDGTWKWLLWRMAVQETGEMVAIARNLTPDQPTDEAPPSQTIVELVNLNQRLQQELAERSRIEAALRESQARFSGILEIADDAIISIDASQHITLFNQGAEKIFGYSAAEVIGQPLDILLPLRSITAHRKHVSDFDDSTGQARRMGERRRIFGRRKDGTEFPAEASISCLSLGEEKIFTVILRDVTDRQQIERMKDEFVSVVSHELRTPLTSIHGSLGMLASGLLSAESDRGKRLLQIAADSTDRLVRLINDILDIERIESGKVTMAKQPCNAADLIREAVEVMQPMADKAGVILSAFPMNAQLWADPDRILQTLTNLLSNAIKFSPRGATVWLSAKVRTEGRGLTEILDGNHSPAEVLITVRDQGRGIPADKLNTIFERFQQVDASDSRNHDGTGLGLAICRSITQQHNGRIWVDSTLGKGSTFYFTLPLHQQEQCNLPNAPLSGSLVLVCDDDPGIRTVLQTLLEQHNYQVVTVATGEAAIDQAVQLRPDVILLDLLMPEMNGWQVMAVLKEREETRHIPIVICSVCPAMGPGSNSGFVDWIEKPLDEALLFQSLRQALAHPSRKVRVLVVEDDLDLAQVLLTLFQQHDIETFHAPTGREAIRLSQQLNPDLLVLDLVLPGGDGFTVVEWLRQHNSLHSVPLVVYSAKDLNDAERDRLRLGQTEFLTKGRVTPQDFEQRVMGLLQRITSSRQKSDANPLVLQ